MLCINSVYSPSEENCEVYFEGTYRNVNNNTIVNLMDSNSWIKDVKNDQQVLIKLSHKNNEEEDYFTNTNCLEKERLLFEKIRKNKNYSYYDFLLPECVFYGKIQNLKKDNVIYENFYHDSGDLKFVPASVYLYKKVDVVHYDFLKNSEKIGKMLEFIGDLKKYTTDYLRIKYGQTQDGNIYFYELCSPGNFMNSLPFKNVNNTWEDSMFMLLYDIKDSLKQGKIIPNTKVLNENDEDLCSSESSLCSSESSDYY